jgi:hypothetical protein
LIFMKLLSKVFSHQNSVCLSPPSELHVQLIT